MIYKVRSARAVILHIGTHETPLVQSECSVFSTTNDSTFTNRHLVDHFGDRILTGPTGWKVLRAFMDNILCLSQSDRPVRFTSDQRIKLVAEQCFLSITSCFPHSSTAPVAIVSVSLKDADWPCQTPTSSK